MSLISQNNIFLQIMQLRCSPSLCRNLMGLTTTKAFLKPNQASHITQVAGTKRGPPRYFGRTKSQYLDFGYRSHAYVMASVSVFTIPLLIAILYYMNVILKPKIEEAKQKEEEELLSEGAFQKS